MLRYLFSIAGQCIVTSRIVFKSHLTVNETLITKVVIATGLTSYLSEQRS